ncbi:MAG TPA: VanZ family protein [Patescibacteria group bacterium]|nr:VanZ family protein [Patescibacteria group bacterium]
MKLIKNFVIYWIPPLLWMSTIFYFSSQPHFNISSETTLDFILFKILHMIEYGFLYFLLFRALYKTGSYTLPEIFLLTFIIGALYAISDEYHQSFVPTREGKMRDVLIDIGGITIVYWYMKNNFARIKKYVV